MEKNKTIIFCDGASKGNPGPGGYGGIIIKNKKENTKDEEREVLEIGGREEHTTNNRMELMGAIKALEALGQGEALSEIIVYTDSKYLIGGMTMWMKNWIKNDWKKGKRMPNGKTNGEDVLNRDLWEQLSTLAEGKKINWQYVAGHTGHVGNERCDEIASGLALNEKIDLYEGSLAQYQVPITEFIQNEQ